MRKRWVAPQTEWGGAPTGQGPKGSQNAAVGDCLLGVVRGPSSTGTMPQAATTEQSWARSAKLAEFARLKDTVIRMEKSSREQLQLETETQHSFDFMRAEIGRIKQSIAALSSVVDDELASLRSDVGVLREEVGHLVESARAEHSSTASLLAESRAREMRNAEWVQQSFAQAREQVAQLKRDLSDSKAQLLEASGSHTAAVSELSSNLAEVVASTRELQQQVGEFASGARLHVHAPHTAGAPACTRTAHAPCAPQAPRMRPACACACACACPCACACACARARACSMRVQARANSEGVSGNTAARIVATGENRRRLEHEAKVAEEARGDLQREIDALVAWSTQEARPQLARLADTGGLDGVQVRAILALAILAVAILMLWLYLLWLYLLWLYLLWLDGVQALAQSAHDHAATLQQVRHPTPCTPHPMPCTLHPDFTSTPHLSLLTPHPSPLTSGS